MPDDREQIRREVAVLDDGPHTSIVEDVAGIAANRRHAAPSIFWDNAWRYVADMHVSTLPILVRGRCSACERQFIMDVYECQIVLRGTVDHANRWTIYAGQCSCGTIGWVRTGPFILREEGDHCDQAV